MDSKFLWQRLEFNRRSRDIGCRSDCLSRVHLSNFRQFGTMRFSQMSVPPIQRRAANCCLLRAFVGPDLAKDDVFDAELDAPCSTIFRSKTR